MKTFVWDAHFAKNNAAIRNFLIHMEGLRKKCESKDFSPLSELKTLARVLLDALDNTVVYEICNIDRDPSLKPSVMPIRDIKQYHCFQFIDADHVDCCIMCGDAFPSIPIQIQPLSQSTSVKQDDNDDTDDNNEKQVDPTQHNIHHLRNIDTAELQLDVDDDDVVDEEQQAIEPEQTSSASVAALFLLIALVNGSALLVVLFPPAKEMTTMILMTSILINITRLALLACVQVAHQHHHATFPNVRL